jgi:hypothetical protein
MKYHVVAIGQLPPPVHGFSNITKWMIELLAEENTVAIENLSTPESLTGPARHASKLIRTLKACRRLPGDRRRGNLVCYIACEGGWGMIYTLLVVFA